jgi:FkbM family methyltransferase
VRIINAGANTGVATQFFKLRFPNTQIISVEPENANYAMLKHNIEVDNMQNVSLPQAGLWQRQVQLEVGRDFGDRREWLFYVKESDQSTGLEGYDVQHLMQKAS